MGSFDDMLDDVFGTPKLNPPPAPKPTPIIIDPEDNIDYDKIANSSEFKRFICLIRTGKTFRGSNAELEVKLVKTEQQIALVKEIDKGTNGDFKSVVAELKSLFAKHKNRSP